jgi:hypothetical protein
VPYREKLKSTVTLSAPRDVAQITWILGFASCQPDSLFQSWKSDRKIDSRIGIPTKQRTLRSFGGGRMNSSMHLLEIRDKLTGYDDNVF